MTRRRDLSEELVKHRRGDTSGSADLDGQTAILNDLHTYYKDIESVYRDRILSLFRSASDESFATQSNGNRLR